MREYSTLAAVDLGSNSFHLQVARVVDKQLYPLDSLKEMIRLAGGITADKKLDESSQERALDCLKRFGERLRGFPTHAVRVVGTNSLRVAKNAAAFLRKAEGALGFPIEIIAGHEEARLIYLGVAHALPASDNNRLVIDIGGKTSHIPAALSRQSPRTSHIHASDLPCLQLDASRQGSRICRQDDLRRMAP
jgi:exopolyphosphatase/guanosine-5'-triphosphate,3'-diphosphate pyrophosphatase